MTETQNFVMSVFECHPNEWLSPTFVGNQRATWLHSAWASPRCKALVASGHLERNDRGHYKLKKARQETDIQQVKACHNCAHVLSNTPRCRGCLTNKGYTRWRSSQ